MGGAKVWARSFDLERARVDTPLPGDAVRLVMPRPAAPQGANLDPCGVAPRSPSLAVGDGWEARGGPGVEAACQIGDLLHAVQL